MTENEVHIACLEYSDENDGTPNPLPPVILLHGLTSSKECWKPCIKPIINATGRKVMVYDARNHGDSGWNEDCSYNAMASDLLALMAQMQVSKAVLVGHSMGGKVAMNFALKHPDMVEKLVVEDISKNIPPGLLQNVRDSFGRLMGVIKSIPPEITDVTAANQFIWSLLRKATPQEHRSDRHFEAEAIDLPLKQKQGGGFEWKTNLEGLQKSLQKVVVNADPHTAYSGPALFIYGTKSPFKVLDDREYIFGKFTAAKLVGIEGGAHLLHNEFPEEFNETLISFIKAQ